MVKLYTKREHLFMRWLIFMIGLVIVSFGIALMIRADLGSAPWDVLHIGLRDQLGLTVGTWSIIIGIIVIVMTSLLQKETPQAGGIVNMLLIGVFIDIFLLLIETPSLLAVQIIMLLAGIIIIGYGIGLYIAPEVGAGPRDSLMIALHERTGWKISRVRIMMETVVLAVGWALGGPVFVGTILFCLGIGQVVGFAMPQTSKLVHYLIERGGRHENFNKRTLRPYHNDGISKKTR
ncbi:hypothetical protein ATL39_2291 [Sinobaca qinghaiensis]|uniref:Membrane protein YczE n=1 Tax=Sinobaca qinghaiensis TaxID=342944 RepID=A0A419V3L3_9BACL|nr:YitT family protein [Sinobaca qinghaiensis]RKD73088.1 hypothetical protein ATL39_2291 [Sinobaca qinghaiensis]